MKRKTVLVMLGTRDNWHLNPEQTAAFAGLLTGHCDLMTHFCDDGAYFTMENIAKYDAVVLWTAIHRDMETVMTTEKALENVFKAVESGATQLLSLHGGVFNISINGNRTLEEKIGCSYADPHYPFQKIRVIIEKEHPITAGVTEFTVYDEPYRFDLIGSEMDLLATYSTSEMLTNDISNTRIQENKRKNTAIMQEWGVKNENAPLLYTRTIGKGRAIVFALGHDEMSLCHPSVQKLTKQSFAWLFG